MQANERVQAIAHKLAMLYELKPFVDGVFQPHHRGTTVLDHSIHVAEVSVKIASFLEKYGANISYNELIRGCASS